MKQLTALVLISVLPAFGHSALLRYELEFTPWSWPYELIEEGIYPAGNGHLVADTELNAIVGGALKCDLFDFVWNNVTPSSMTFEDTYYGYHVVNGGAVQGTDMMSGVNGDLSLTFLLPPGLGNYSDSLDQHFNEDIWSELAFPEDGHPAEQWEHFYLGLLMTISSPTVVGGTPVPEPTGFVLLSLGLVAVGGARFARRESDKARILDVQG